MEVEDRHGRVAQKALRVVVVPASPLAPQPTQTDAAAPVKAAEAVADPVRHVQARWFACLPDAEAAIAEYEGQRQGPRGRRPRLGRYPVVRSHLAAETRRARRPRRRRPAKMAPPPMASSDHLVVAVEALANPAEDHGWTVLATTVDAAVWPDADILQAYQDQHPTVEPGVRWRKNPAAIAPGWREKPERLAA